MIASEGKTCWRTCRADRLAFLVDGDEYFRRAAEAIERAERSVLVIGWDIHSRTVLRPAEGDGPSGATRELAPLLERCVRRKKRLRVHLLDWDFAMLYALEREPVPKYHLGWKTHRRIRFELDGRHPVGGCHHQKIVVVDDEVAFLGGLDLTIRRWDTPEHRPSHPLRVDPSGRTYQPFHDVQVIVSGQAAACLGELARERWRRATGREIADARATGEPWPGSLAPDLRDVTVALARTDPAYEDRPEVREILAMYERAIDSARRWIYVESQYLSAEAIGNALVRCLERETGPEVVLVLPERVSGWLEEGTIGAMRRRILERLRSADHGGRLRALRPRVAGLGDDWIKVHSKLCVVDDAFVTVGSANLSNRSMGLDTECNLFLEAGDRTDVSDAIRDFRARLIGEHLGVAPEEVSSETARRGSVIDTIEALAGGRRTLLPLDDDGEKPAYSIPILQDVADPERPIEAGELVATLLPEHAREREETSGSLPKVLWVGVLALVALAVAWRWGPLSEWTSQDQLGEWARRVRESPLSLVVSIGIFVLGGLVMFPVTLLILQMPVVFGPVRGALYAGLGSLASAAVGFGLGRLLGRRRVRRLVGARGNRVLGLLDRHSTLAVAAVRMMPIAPFTLVNLAAGAAGLRWGSYLLGTLLGMAPGILAISVIEHGAVRVLESPSISGIALLAIGAAAALWGLIRLGRGIRRRAESGPTRSSGPERGRER
jgi:phosphatidylserine/phosphatidylglycerophosphate/cardiolipin synthase-like enzyme/uncharacterized membrane protein YdjX (TVP38/TMEM64 family)